jgi:hypothetical protein
MEMTTRVYGCSDDLIEFEGDVRGEVGHFESDDDGPGALLVCSDGTLLRIRYGKSNRGIWEIRVMHKGPLFDRIEQCDDDEAQIYSDQAFFRDGLKWAYAATTWQQVQ